jgi:DNA polymerase III alpha subunit
MTLIKPPNRFVGLHAHTGFSVYDGLGYPQDHIEFVINNGMDAWAITDHGNANGHPFVRKHADKLQKAGRKFKPLFGVEFYFVPSLKEWEKQYSDHREAMRNAKLNKKANDDIDVESDIPLVIVDDEEEAAHVVEDEDETRNIDVTQDEWKRRYHLVVIAKNQKGLHNLYALVKKSFKDGFYRFPRIDFELLREHGEGLVVSTACLGGIFSNQVLRRTAVDQNDLEIYNALENMADRFVDSVGKDNFFLEIQFNKLEAQHTVNKYIIGLSDKTGIPLVATADSHYYNQNLWEARELYRRLGWKGKDEMKLPTLEELKCELYPKNAGQMWDEYMRFKDKFDFYEGTEELVKGAIERTHDIAWDVCEDVWIDRKAKLPDFSRPEKSAFEQLVDLVKEGMVRNNLHEKKEYVDRIYHELSDIKELGFENYFLVMLPRHESNFPYCCKPDSIRLRSRLWCRLFGQLCAWNYAG